MRRKVGSTFLAAVMLCSTPAVVIASGQAVVKVESHQPAGEERQAPAAGPTISEARAREILEPFLPAEFRGKPLKANLEDVYMNGEKANWSFNLNDPRYPGRDFWANIDAVSGEVTSFYYEPDMSQFKGLQIRLTRDQALDIAKGYLNSRLGSRVNELVLSEDGPIYKMRNDQIMFSPVYSFEWNRKVNGVIVDGNNARIGVNAFSGKVQQYFCNWKDSKYQAATAIKPADEIGANILDRMGLCLSYDLSPLYLNRGSEPINPSYRLNCQAAYLDPTSGQFFDYQGRLMSDDQARLYNAPIVPDPKRNGSAAAANKPDPGQTAEKIFSLLGYSGKVSKRGGGSRGGIRGGEQYFSTYALDDGDEQLEVRIDDSTGEMVGFTWEDGWMYSGRSKSAGPGGITWPEAQSKGWEMVKKLNPGLVDQLIPSNDQSASFDKVFQVNFTRLIYGLPCPDQGIRLTFLASSGEIVDYEVEWDQLPVQPPQNIISEEEARSLIDPAQLLTLVYHLPDGESEPKYDSPLLVYNLARKGIDALTGKAIKDLNSSQNIGHLPPSFAGDQNYAALSLLWYNGLMSSRALQPGDAVVQKDVLQILRSLKQGGYRFYSGEDPEEAALSSDKRLVRWAFKEGLIENENQVNLNQPLSRKEFALWAVRLLDFGSIAEMKNKIELPASDARDLDASYWNPMGIAYGLNILGVREPGKLEPDQPLTWSDLGQALAPLVTLQKGFY